MRLARFVLADGGDPRLGVVADGHVNDVTDLVGEPAGADPMLALIEHGTGAVERIANEHGACPSHSLDEVRLLAPIGRFARNLFAVGRNYRTHIVEGARARGVEPEFPERPVFFTKAPSTVIGPGDSIVVDPTTTAKPDYEGEIVIVIGKAGINIAEDDALDHVFGYTLANDVSARDAQFAHVQWFKGKNFDTFCPLGPWIQLAGTVDEAQLEIVTSVNGEQRQHDNTANFIFTVGRLIAELSVGLTLRPGDVILTGTPEGVGFAMDPPRFLADGDTVEVRCPQIGSLLNPVVVRQVPG